MGASNLASFDANQNITQNDPDQFGRGYGPVRWL
jgi:hypothetical protein